jgi:TRAP-type C4-dicarboxylate transport system permease small subunit
MLRRLNQLFDRLSEYFAARRGLLPLLGILLVVGNWVLRLVLPQAWPAQNDLLLHLGVVLALLGFLMAWAL